MPALRLLDVSRNNLSGVVPSGWGVPGLSLFVTSGELTFQPGASILQIALPRIPHVVVTMASATIIIRKD